MLRFVRIADRITDILLTAFFVIVFAAGVYSAADTYHIYHSAVSREAFVYKPGKEDSSAEGTGFTLSDLSDDAVAWIEIAGTGIDHPVMQGANNSEYLNKDPFGRYSLSGSIFLDSRNSADFEDPYSLIYGHHMEGGVMFGALDSFFDEKYAKEHRKGTLILADGTVLDLSLFAVVRTDVSDSAVFDPGDLDGLLAAVREKAVYYREPETAHVAGLSTCSSASSGERLVVLFEIGSIPDPQNAAAAH
ncbi:MAG: class B sortase [Lachnospiraceae bacterium]|nr:class B sortase [Lachnospiraceae bacterium]